MEEKKAVLQGQHLYKTYHSAGRTVRPLQDISFSLAEGEILGIAGESGSGKSTLLRVVSGLEKPDRGQVLAMGEDLTGRGPAAAGKHMQMIFQDAYASFDPRMTLRQSLKEAGAFPETEIECLPGIPGETELEPETLGEAHVNIMTDNGISKEEMLALFD